MVPDDEKKDEDPGQAVKELLHTLPEQPGVYLFKDQKGNILYIGKAINLLKRIKSYFSGELSPKHKRLISKIDNIDFIITSSETEALILECQLIKKYRPKYNVRLKDDKTYPYLKINLNELFPMVSFTRRRQEDGACYFGPFASARSLRLTINTLKKLFPFRSCTRKLALQPKDKRACLEYDLGRCLAPCIGAISQQEYLKTIEQVINFLEGKAEEIKRQLEQEMNRAAENLEFEKAAKLRDQLFALKKITEQQKIISSDKDIDVISLALSAELGCAQVFFIRQGRLMGREVFFLEGIEGETPPSIMTGFVKQFYHASASIPGLILLQHPIEDKQAILSWLTTKKGSSVEIETPAEGEKLELLLLCNKNAQEALELYRIKKLSNSQLLSQALLELKEKLLLPGLPRRIECYDISDIRGEYAVGSLVVFEDGKPKPALYRRFRIKLTEGIDDPGMLAEVLERRLKRLQEPSWGIKPDLILIDGGRSQLSAALKVLREFGEKIPPVALAKEKEEIYLPGSVYPLKLLSTSPALNLLRYIRDEAHRFALNYHLKLRRRSTFASPLDEIPGIGAKRKKILLKHFGSLAALREAPVEKIASLPGMTRKLAERIKETI